MRRISKLFSRSRLVPDCELSIAVEVMAFLRSFNPKPVLKVFMKALRLGIVADISDQQSSHSARTIAGTQAISGVAEEATRLMYMACEIASAATLGLSVEIQDFRTTMNLPESKSERQKHLNLHVERDLQGPDDENWHDHEYHLGYCVNSSDSDPFQALADVRIVAMKGCNRTGPT